MTKSTDWRTAQIYAFPAGGRAALRRERESLRPAPDLPLMTFGSGWYHDAAIQEAAPARKHDGR